MKMLDKVEIENLRSKNMASGHVMAGKSRKDKKGKNERNRP